MRGKNQAAPAAAVLAVVPPQEALPLVCAARWPQVILDRATGELHRELWCAEVVAEGVPCAALDGQGKRLIVSPGGWETETHLAGRLELPRCPRCWFGAIFALELAHAAPAS
jgi:hypothetical protein